MFPRGTSPGVPTPRFPRPPVFLARPPRQPCAASAAQLSGPLGPVPRSSCGQAPHPARVCPLPGTSVCFPGVAPTPCVPRGSPRAGCGDPCPAPCHISSSPAPTCAGRVTTSGDIVPSLSLLPPRPRLPQDASCQRRRIPVRHGEGAQCTPCPASGTRGHPTEPRNTAGLSLLVLHETTRESSACGKWNLRESHT